MPGFPVRPSRAAFGPTLENHAPVVNNRKQIAASTFNLGWWQLAGAGLAVDQAWAIVSAAGLLLASGEVWDPEGLVLPVVTNPSTGVYELEYPATAEDEDGTALPISFIGGHATANGATRGAIANVEIFSTRFVRVLTSTHAGAALACAFHVGAK